MKKTIIILSAIILVSCNEKNEKPTLKDGVYIGVYKREGKKMYGEIIRITQDKIIYDSVKKVKTVASQMLCGTWAKVPAVDSLNKPIKDSVVWGWKAISCDSVNFHVENITIDSLLKN